MDPEDKLDTHEKNTERPKKERWNIKKIILYFDHNAFGCVFYFFHAWMLFLQGH